MDVREAIRLNIEQADNIVKMYLNDLKESEFFVRPVPDANHIAWQLGHLIVGENWMINAVAPGSMPPLPAGFDKKYTKETSKLDDPKAFDSKDELLRNFKQQRAGTLAALAKMSDTDLDKPVPDDLKSFLRNVGETFVMQGVHVVMHAGQWAIVRRKLGRPPVF